MQYHKIQTLFLRNPETNYKTLLDGQYARPEFEYLKDVEWVFTEKVDGTNIRVMWKGGEPAFGGKTDRAQIPPFLLDKLKATFDPETMFSVFVGDDVDVTLYGEGYGAKIQKGGGDYIPDGVGFILFDVMVGGIWLERHNVEDVAQALGIPVVPVVGRGPLTEMVRTAKDGDRSLVAHNVRHPEGIVARPACELTDRMGRRVITKLKRKDFPQ